ncbi:MAG: DUF2079 domain-containing protein [Chloroflexota bacterium]|nr:DUF2079 domain-containing protein [Chloroflexota bacterium]
MADVEVPKVNAPSVTIDSAPVATATKKSIGSRLYSLLDSHAGRILFTMVCLYILVFSVGSSFKYETYQTGYDQVYFEQALWNTSQGRFMQQSDFNYSTSAFSVDFMPGLVLFVPLYWLLPSPHTLFFIESVILALGALPIFWLAKAKLGSRPVALGFVAAYLLNPTLEYFNLLPFNMRALGLVALLYTFYFFEKQKFWPFIGFALLAMSTRTEVSLVIAIFGLYGLLRRVPWRFWLPPLIAGPLYFVLIFAFILPLFIKTGDMIVPPGVEPVQLSLEQVDFISGTNTIISTNYGDLGKSLPDVLINTLTKPDKTFKQVVTVNKALYLLALLLPFAFLSLLSPSVMLFALPLVAINLLSSRPIQADYRSHYSALLLFPLAIGAIYGSANLLRLWKAGKLGGSFKLGRWPIASLGSIMLLLFLALIAASVIQKNPLPGVLRNREVQGMVGPMNKEILSVIPSDASVSSTSFLGSHLLPRQYSYAFPLALYNPPPEAMQYFLIDTNAIALYDPANSKAFGGKLPIDFVQKDGRWKLVKAITVKGQKDKRGEPRQIQLWQKEGPNVPPLREIKDR